ncbi:hypothetical protein HYY75_10290 [bacterium]|nr:hypothetical protein [bacterium]
MEVELFEIMLLNYVKKILVIVFAFYVFQHVFKYSGRRDLISFLGTMLMITMIYVELLIIRDEIWVLEGITRESLRWRDAFFPHGSIYRQRIRKLIIVIFAMVVFTWVYVRTKGPEIYAYVGIILMATALYYEILSLRDEVRWIAEKLQSQQIESIIRKESTDPSASEGTPALPPMEQPSPQAKPGDAPPGESK